MEFAGEFETHVTVAMERGGEPAALRRWASRQGLKCLDIVLERGSTPRQPMLTRRGRGLLSSERAAADELARGLSAAGFSVLRIKIEAGLDNEDIPRTDEDAVLHPAGRYFEHHVKLLLEAGTDVAALAQLAQRHSAHMSRNTFRLRADQREERFVTQRCGGVGSATAGNRLRRLLADISRAGYRQIGLEEEFVVYDSNLRIDAGWIEEAPADE